MLKRLAMIFGAIFVLVGCSGLCPNPLVGPEGFSRRTAHTTSRMC